MFTNHLSFFFTFLTCRRLKKNQLKAFSELDNNLEYHFYDFNDRTTSTSNPIRLQYLNRISDGEFNAYLSSNNGLDLANEDDIIREENLHDCLIAHPNTSRCSTTMGKLVTNNGKPSNDKAIFYNPKYERKSDCNCGGTLACNHVCNHHSNNNQTSLTNHLTGHFSTNHLPTARNGFNTFDQSDRCDLKFVNCNCTLVHKGDDTIGMSVIKDVKNKPPTGKQIDQTSSTKSRLNTYEIVDTKL